MAFLEMMNEEFRMKVISLPYRTGLWVSESDKTGGDDSDDAELEALESIITSFGEDFLKSEFVEEVMQSTLDSMDLWDDWGDDLDTVPEDCAAVIEYLRSQLTPVELENYKQNLMDIATSIAIAYREVDEGGAILYKVGIYADYFVKKAMATVLKKQQPNLEYALNISRDEKKALAILAGALEINLDDAIRAAMP